MPTPPQGASGEGAATVPALSLLPPAAPDGLRQRLGLGVPGDLARFGEDTVRNLGFGWYLDWTVRAEPFAVSDVASGGAGDGLSAGPEFAQMVRAGGDFVRQRASIAAAVAANPGTLWLIGNEPDVPWQDNTTPDDYARFYHQAYMYIKSLDPSAQVAIGGVSQPTPLRLLYLEAILDAYEARFARSMPVDVWNVHAFILREERDSWGVSIPPGFDVDQGMLYEIEDHDDLEIFKQQIIDFRRWMSRQGLRDKPLIVSEYGILMPESYGFPSEAVADFMIASFDFLLQARDPDLGYPADDNRLVQRLAWFSLGDTIYPTSNLLDPATGILTPLGHAFAAYAAGLDDAKVEGP